MHWLGTGGGSNPRFLWLFPGALLFLFLALLKGILPSSLGSWSLGACQQERACEEGERVCETLGPSKAGPLYLQVLAPRWLLPGLQKEGRLSQACSGSHDFQLLYRAPAPMPSPFSAPCSLPCTSFTLTCCLLYTCLPQALPKAQASSADNTCPSTQLVSTLQALPWTALSQGRVAWGTFSAKEDHSTPVTMPTAHPH